MLGKFSAATIPVGYVLCFSLCGPEMWVWESDRAGATASTQFNMMNNIFFSFVKTVLGFALLNHEQLGYDLTICIRRGNEVEVIVLDEVIRRTSGVICRAQPHAGKPIPIAKTTSVLSKTPVSCNRTLDHVI